MKKILLLLPLLIQSALAAEEPARLIQFTSSPNEQWCASLIQRGEEGDFTLRLVNIASNTLMWTEQIPGNQPPTALLPADNGTLVLGQFDFRFRVFDAAGKPGEDVWVRIPEIEREKYVRTFVTFPAGDEIAIWRNYSKKGFLNLENEPYFYYRTYWGHLLAISLDTCTQITNPETLAHIEQGIVEEIRARAACMAENLFRNTPCDSCGEYHLKAQVLEDSFIIRQYRLPEGEVFLQKLFEENEKVSNGFGWESLLKKL